MAETTSSANTPLSAQEIHGPCLQLLTHLQGRDARVWLEALQRFLREEDPWTVFTPAETEFRASVDYALSFTQMIDAGRYDWWNEDITPERFPISGQGRKDLSFRLVSVNRAASSDEALERIRALGLRPANFEELLGFVAAYPDEQRKYPICALGSIAAMHGDFGVPAVSKDGPKRRLSIYFRGGGGTWINSIRFLVVAPEAAAP